jgi:hypothetical protein
VISLPWEGWVSAKLLMLSQSVFFVGKYIIQVPFLPVFHGFLPHLTIFYGADGTTKRHTSVGVNKKFNAISHF